MIVVLMILSFILIFWVTRLTSQVSDLKKTAQYNLEVYDKKISEIDRAFDSEREQREYLLERIQDIEKEMRK